MIKCSSTPHEIHKNKCYFTSIQVDGQKRIVHAPERIHFRVQTQIKVHTRTRRIIVKQ